MKSRVSVIIEETQIQSELLKFAFFGLSLKIQTTTAASVGEPSDLAKRVHLFRDCFTRRQMTTLRMSLRGRSDPNRADPIACVRERGGLCDGARASP